MDERSRLSISTQALYAYIDTVSALVLVDLHRAQTFAAGDTTNLGEIRPAPDNVGRQGAVGVGRRVGDGIRQPTGGALAGKLPVWGGRGLSANTAMGSAVRCFTAALSLAFAACWPVAALAYRPFDGSDAAVATPGEFEIELGPVQYLRQGQERFLVAPAVTMNYGFAEGWEAVLEGQAAHGLSAETKRTSLVGNGGFLKRVLREGSLQEKSGPSIAAEFGVLLPGVNDEPGVGGSVGGIISQQWTWLTVHLNAEVALTRQQHGDLFFTTILEGPHDWIVRPATELSYERDFGRLRTTSALVGAIWQVRENLAVDFGLREARINNHTLNELRAGLTFSFPLR